MDQAARPCRANPSGLKKQAIAALGTRSVPVGVLEDDIGGPWLAADVPTRRA